MFEAETTEGYKICLRGDLVINTLWAWMGAMGVAFVDGIVSPAYNVYAPTKELDPTYIDALVRLRVFAQEVTRYSMACMVFTLTAHIPMGSSRVNLPVPPVAEQTRNREIICRERLDGIDTDLKESVTLAHALIVERRSALIAGAVTGQIEVDQES